MTLKELCNELNKINDKSLTVAMAYGDIYPITNATMYDCSYRFKWENIAVGICFRNREKFQFTVNNLIDYINELINGDSGIGPSARVFIEADGYKGMPEEIRSVKLTKIKVRGKFIETVILRDEDSYEKFIE